jgi:hypothetical protein
LLNQDGLRALIEQRTKEQPIDRDGYLWAKDPYEWGCSELGVSRPTLREWLKDPKIQIKSTQNELGR